MFFVTSINPPSQWSLLKIHSPAWSKHFAWSTIIVSVPLIIMSILFVTINIHPKLQTAGAWHLKRPPIRPAYQRRKLPGDRCQYNEKCNGKPNCYCLKLFAIGLFAFCFCRTDGDNNNCRYHHQTMFHPKKTDFPLMNRVFVVMQKIVNNGADKIKPNP